MPVLEVESATLAPARRENALLALIPRWRWLFFALIGLLMISAFNGRWRIGRDSAAYRGLAHQLLTTGKYVFRDKHDTSTFSDQQDTRYPGMPLVLAGIEKICGRGDLPAVLFVTLSAIATLVLTHRLVKPAVPPWLAIAIVFGMGANGRFLEHSNEILSDMPFLLGVVLSLLAFDRLERARCTRTRVIALSMLIVGLILAAAMRPTFWVLALALVFTCLWGLVQPTHAGQTAEDRRPRRLACLMTLGVLAIAAGTFAGVVDLRGKEAAGYEGRLRARLDDFRAKVLEPLPQNVYAVCEQTLPEAFCGTQLGPGFIPVGGGHWVGMSTIFSLLLVGTSVALVRRNVLWGVFALLTVLTMAGIGSVPRYFIMILPLLLAGWGLALGAFADRFRTWGLKEAIAFAGLGLVVIPNLISCANLIREQRGLARPQEGLAHVGFERAYHGGKWAGVGQVATMIRQNVRPDQQVIGPEATVLTYLSDRNVFGLGRFLPVKDRGGAWDRELRKLRGRFAYAVFPDATSKFYDDKDVVTGRLIKLGLLRPTRTIAAVTGYRLCEYEVVPAGVKKHGHVRDLSASTQPKVKSTSVRRHRPAATGPSATQPAGPRRGRRGRPPAVTTMPATKMTVPAAPEVERRPAVAH